MLGIGERIRLASVEDAAELLEIYRPYIEKTAITFEVEVPSVEEFAGRIRHTLEKYPYLVAEEQGRIVGYAYASPFKTRAAYDWSVDLCQNGRTEQRNRKCPLYCTGGNPGRAEYHKCERMYCPA